MILIIFWKFWISHIYIWT